MENIHPVAEQVLRQRGVQVSTISGSLEGDELVDALQGIDLLGIRSATMVTRKVLARTSLTSIGAFCIGTNQIDLAAAARDGVPVFNAPYSNTRSVVELAIGEIIMLARRLGEKNDRMHAGVWDKTATGSHEIRGRTVGIVGYGNIGSQLSVVAEALGMRVIFYDVADKLALGNARRCDSLEELLAEAEVVSLHVDGRRENRGLFGENQFAQMRERSLFLNLCRGMVVDHDALVKHLASGRIAGAAIDVFGSEPRRNGAAFESPLRGMGNVVLTPHIGGSTQEAQHDIGRFVAGKLVDFAEHGSTAMSVNLPEVLADHRHQGTRVLHIHHNVPGVLARLNQVFANYGANIAFQTLATRGSLGYVVTDVGDCGDDLQSELESLEETIRVRLS